MVTCVGEVDSRQQRRKARTSVKARSVAANTKRS